MSVIAIVPVKGQSERLNKKNFQNFLDCPMYEHKLKQLQKVPFSAVLVSSEDPEVVSKAGEYGFVGHLRDPKYSTSHIPMSEVFKYLAEASEAFKEDEIAWVNVNNPLVTSEYYTMALEDWELHKKTNDCLLSVSNLTKYVFWQGNPINWDPSNHPKSQDLWGLSAMNFAINIRPRKDVIKNGCFVGKKPYFFYIDPYTATKVDYKEDMEICKLLWKMREDRKVV